MTRVSMLLRICLGFTAAMVISSATIGCHENARSTAKSGDILRLKSFIGLAALPNDTTAIATIPTVDTLFDAAGPRVGDTIHDFTLFTPEGKPINIKSEIAKGKPVLLVTGSYTCPSFRGSMKVLNTICAHHLNAISPFVVYVVEPHPTGAVCPYGDLNELQQGNVADNTFCFQEKTYGERREKADEITRLAPILPVVIVDGPENNFWLNFGHAPNCVYVLDLQGRVAFKGGWFNRVTWQVDSVITSILHTASVNQ